jgi:hypothetical protein
LVSPKVVSTLQRLCLRATTRVKSAPSSPVARYSESTDCGWSARCHSYKPASGEQPCGQFRRNPERVGVAGDGQALRE